MVISLIRYRETRNIALSIPIGERISIARSNRGLTQEALAKILGKDRSVVSRWETGALYPHPEDVAAIAEALHAPDLLKHYCRECPVARIRAAMTRPAPGPSAA